MENTAGVYRKGALPDGSRNTEEYLMFSLGCHIFCMKTRHIWAVIEHENCDEIIRLPNTCKGVVWFRGEWMTIIDLRQAYDSGRGFYGGGNCVILTRYNGIKIGYIVDHTYGTVRQEKSDIEPVSSYVTDYGNISRISGTFSMNGDRIYLINVEEVFGNEYSGTLKVIYEKTPSPVP